MTRFISACKVSAFRFGMLLLGGVALLLFVMSFSLWARQPFPPAIR